MRQLADLSSSLKSAAGGGSIPFQRRCRRLSALLYAVSAFVRSVASSAAGLDGQRRGDLLPGIDDAGELRRLSEPCWGAWECRSGDGRERASFRRASSRCTVYWPQLPACTRASPAAPCTGSRRATRSRWPGGGLVALRCFAGNNVACHGPASSSPVLLRRASLSPAAARGVIPRSVLFPRLCDARITARRVSGMRHVNRPQRAAFRDVLFRTTLPLCLGSSSLRRRSE